MIRFQSLKEVWGNYVRYFWVNVPNRENRENREGGEKQLLRGCSLAPGTYTAGAAETSSNFARNSPMCFLYHTLETAEYQRSDFKV